MRYLLFLALLSLPLLARADAPATQFTIADLGAIPKSDYAPGAQALNDRGQVAGGFGHAFLWDNGRTKDLGTLPSGMQGESQSSIAQAVNNRGQVVGTSGSFAPILMSGLDEGGFLFGNNVLRYLTRQGENDQFEPKAINDKGQIVGEDRHTYRGFFYADGRLRILGTFSKLPAGNYSAAQGINRLGQVAGWSTVPARHHRDLPVHAFLWQRGGKSGRMRDLGTLPGWVNSYAYGVNDRDEVAGAVSNAPDSTYDVQPTPSPLAFFWRRGKMVSLGVLPGSRGSEAHGINNAGEVVGWSDDRAFLWQNGRMRDLNALIPTGAGWVLTSAVAINNKGQIAGNGTLHGQPHAFLLTPH